MLWIGCLSYFISVGTCSQNVAVQKSSLSFFFCFSLGFSLSGSLVVKVDVCHGPCLQQPLFYWHLESGSCPLELIGLSLFMLLPLLAYVFLKAQWSPCVRVGKKIMIISKISIYLL